MSPLAEKTACTNGDSRVLGSGGHLVAIHRSGWAYVRGLVVVACASSALAACHGRKPDGADRLTGHAAETRPAGDSRTSTLAAAAAAADPTAIVAALKARPGSPIGAGVA